MRDMCRNPFIATNIEVVMIDIPRELPAAAVSARHTEKMGKEIHNWI